MECNQLSFKINVFNYKNLAFVIYAFKLLLLL